MSTWKIIVLAGIFLIFLGLALSGKLGPLGHLPGDILIERDTFTFYFPVTTIILLSILLTLISRVL